VFNLSVSPTPSPLGSGAMAADSTAPGEEEAPKDAAGYARRAEAFLARNQYGPASADFEHAMNLAPSDATYAYQAGRARRLDQHLEEALTDFNKAIEIKPDFVTALTARGSLRLQRHDLDAARADMNAAIAASKEDSLPLQISVSYIEFGEYATAVDMLDQWMASHPAHHSWPAALSNRCYARAAAGRELDLALADCEAALAMIPSDRTVLTRRGLVWLRRGELDRAQRDFEAVLKQDPSDWMALYGKGLTALRKGQTKEGENDIKSAAEGSPEIAERFARMGLKPGS
jgi:tetratricopeptide (TPR) repeat protein